MFERSNSIPVRNDLVHELGSFGIDELAVGGLLRPGFLVALFLLLFLRSRDMLLDVCLRMLHRQHVHNARLLVVLRPKVLLGCLEC